MDDDGDHLSNSPSVILAKDVVFGSRSPSVEDRNNSCSREYQLSAHRFPEGISAIGSAVREPADPVISQDDLQAKTRHYARLEGL